MISFLNEQWDLFCDGDEEVKGEMLGQFVGEVILAAFLPAKTLKGLPGIAPQMKIGRLLNSIAKQGKNLSDNVAKLFYNVTEIVGKKPSFALGVMDSAGKLGVKTKEGILDFTSTLKRLAGNEGEAIGNIDKLLDSTKTVWSKISNTAETITGTSIPRRFNIDALGSKFHVHPNATKHMGKRVLSNSQSHGTPMYSQMVLAQLEKSVGKVVKNGKWKESISGKKIIKSDGWDLRFSQKEGDALPVIMHAVFKGSK